MIKGKIVLVPFPFDELSSNKVRPAVCLTTSLCVYNHIVLAFITSRVSANLLETDIVLDSEHADFSETGLRVSSVLKLNRLITVNKTIIRRELGQLSPSLQDEVDKKLRLLFELD
ncbi:MAG: type II toxin-antitoxin system PemK/MazF family toxin [Thiomargarita sp.]|nr:type II toxin-antitoxin system PemK/MazF family toxin [Thiomargarita sp.]